MPEQRNGEPTLRRPAVDPAAAVYRVAISPADVGHRVSLRRRLHDGRTGYGDVVGDLLSWSAGRLVVRTRTGAEVMVDEAALVAGKTVPPPPERR